MSYLRNQRRKGYPRRRPRISILPAGTAPTAANLAAAAPLRGVRFAGWSSR